MIFLLLNWLELIINKYNYVFLIDITLNQF